ncbi:SAM-dependent methyltransferase [Achromobacter ruhlandii]|uniref:class I SAM-dependent methyltransferase n=1 Tax=Achromobacter ruhlandii TaxID=72557 RepID=UPI0021F13D15|nr:SAM-dependent methyltransferase [Achromobacter ruhlandii]MCV6794425.1 SAM-dependent methyltransferase [Achromobacter ruhlandii]MCV6801334.1 SAM-dependent methyltransferase [Achromobacter ruhlandii]MCV6812273.1 SAM-dependent methyltransferase [Achromobacter ruhlandii]MCV6817438.1 SAM-dependent methyltransferase [Achromobacter ruhlandii]
MQRPAPANLPPLPPAAQAHSEAAAAHLRAAIGAASGWLPFDHWMAEALYAPGLGYYAAGNVKLAEADASAPAGDFVTAPQLTPLFARTLARQVAQVLRQTDTQAVLEFGAGTGALAEGVLRELDALGLQDTQYLILEVSADLRARQAERLAPFGERVRWLDALPDRFRGCVLANEVLDAMPVSLFRWGDDGTVLERGVAWDATQGFVWEDRPAPPRLAEAVAARMPALPGYVSEINPQAEAWIDAMGRWLEQGAALLIDYGFPQGEYYHPQRAGGTLMCHLRHHAHGDPFTAPGLQDITAHVDFTAMADAAQAAGLQVLGYTSQARFLMNAGLMELLAQLDPSDARAYAQAVAPVQKLLSEAEMGELFKVLAVGRGIAQPLIGFARGDRLGKL